MRCGPNIEELGLKSSPFWFCVGDGCGLLNDLGYPLAFDEECMMYL